MCILVFVMPIKGVPFPLLTLQGSSWDFERGGEAEGYIKVRKAACLAFGGSHHHSIYLSCPRVLVIKELITN